MVAVLDYRTDNGWSPQGSSAALCDRGWPKLRLVEPDEVAPLINEFPISSFLDAESPLEVESLLEVVLSRRVLAVLVSLAVVLGALMLAQSGPPAHFDLSDTSSLSVDAASIGERVVIAAPGDTLWGIASGLADDEDVRPIVMALIERNGGESIRVGQEVVIPVLGG